MLKLVSMATIDRPFSIKIVPRDGPLKLQEHNRMVFAYEGTATFSLRLVLVSAILIAIVDQKRLGHTLSVSQK